MNLQIEESWRAVLAGEFEEPYFTRLKAFLAEEERQYTVYPPKELIFNAFARTPFHKVKVVMLGQDPYPGEGNAHGLSFSIPDGVKPPNSLINIFKEIERDLGISPSQSGNLEQWADQGVFLLNAALTVRAATPRSHLKGWEKFTNTVIQALSKQREHLVFLLWGNDAKAKKKLIDGQKEQKHLILEASHPSNKSKSISFVGCKHFSKTNDYLKQNGLETIDWNV
ncbi:uracil-DNA glycosylase [Planctomycetales bacterium]|nr:uracil-DNA glycosylase [Planctomycetales bacterium]